MKKLINMNKYMEIFISGLRIAFSSFGGGASAIPVIKTEYVDTRKWVGENEFSDMVVLANLLPGPTILQLVLLVSRKQGGWLGAAAGLSAISIPVPALVIIILTLLKQWVLPEHLAKVTFAVLPAVIFMLLSFIAEYFKKTSAKIGFYITLLLTITSFILTRFLLINTAVIFFSAIAAIALLSFASRSKGEEHK